MDWLIRDGTVVQMDPDRTVSRADIWIDGSKIRGIGRNIPGLPSPLRILDAKGCIVIPGLIQGHVHLCQTLFRGMADGLHLLPWLRKRIWPLEAAHTPKTLRASAELGISELLLGGTTTALDMGTVFHTEQIFQAAKQLGIRLISGNALMDRGQIPRLKQNTNDALSESIKLLDSWHKSTGDRLRVALAPRFVLSCSKKLLKNVATLSERHDLLIHSHAAEHAAEKQAVRHEFGASDIDVLRDAGIHGPRAIFAHGVQLTSSQMKRIAREQTRFIHCPSANLKLASGIAKVPAMLKAGMLLGIGADGAPCNNRLDVWTEMRQACLLASAISHEPDALSPSQALAMATIEGAKVLGWDKQIGSIEVGKQADLSIVDTAAPHLNPHIDPIGTLVYSAQTSDVRDVFVAGQHIVRNRALTTGDTSKIATKAHAIGAKLFRSLKG